MDQSPYEERIYHLVQEFARIYAGGILRWYSMDDLIHEAWIKVVSALRSTGRSEQREETLRRLVAKYTRCRIIDLARRSKRWLGESALPSGPPTVPSMGPVTVGDYVAWILHDPRMGLSSKEREVLVLGVEDDLPDERIAEMLGIKSDSVRKDRNRALDKIRTALGRTEDHGSNPRGEQP